MAGGKFISMDKVRPGAYINFETVPSGRVIIGTRGIVTLILPLSWGKEADIIEVTSEDIINGNILAKIGLLASDADALLLNLASQNCGIIKVYNPNTGGTEASVVLGDENGVTVTAKYPGTFGNKIAVLVKAVGTKFNVETYADGYQVDVQQVSAASELKANDFVTFSEGTLEAVASTLLAGGTNGTAPATSTMLTDYFNKLKLTKWNTMAYTLDSELSQVAAFIQNLRENEGKYVQAVVANYDGADYEGIINNVNGVILDGDTIVTPAQFTAWVAGATAGADIAESLTGKVVPNVKAISGLLTNDEIIEALANGKFVLSQNQNGSTKVEKDINSLHTFTANKSYIFSKNRIIRELDEIGSAIEDIWETTYLGKVSNNENGRTLFKSSIIDYLSSLQNRGAIDGFDSSSVEVIAGESIDSVIATIAIKPVDSMEFLYLTVNVEQ